MLILVAILAVDLAGDRRYVIITTAVIAPLLAAALSGPWVTTLYAVLALLSGALQAIPLGYYSGMGHESWEAQAIRLLVITLGGIIAIVASRDRTRREARLRNVTRVADVAQRAILSAVPAEVGCLRLAVSYESAAEEASVGGDLYEVVQTRWGTRILVGDARGKGLDAVRLASRVMATFRVVARFIADPERVVRALDAEVAESGGSEDFVTAVFAQVRGGRLDLINAGHPDPVIYHGGTARLVVCPDEDRRPPLGFGAECRRHGVRGGHSGLVPGVILDVDDRVLFYTDGLAEARHPLTKEYFPLLPAAQEALQVVALDSTLEHLVGELRHWTAAALDDDVALLVAEVATPG